MGKPGHKLPLPGGVELNWGERTLIMGVVNVTPDSFSDGGRFMAADSAVSQGLRLLDEGADILDIGGESTRPGSQPIGVDEECDRVLPVIQRIAALKPRAVISIDTMKAPVAKRALAAGARIINDVTAMRHDPEMAAVAAETGAGVVLMHMKGEPRTMQKNPTYQDLVGEIKEHLAAQAEMAARAGVARERIVIDPGIGFGKTFEHNLSLIRRLDEFSELGYPVLLGASRKAFIGHLTGHDDPGERLWGTVGAHVAGALLGADLVRVHDVAQVREALMVADAIRGAA